LAEQRKKFLKTNTNFFLLESLWNDASREKWKFKNRGAFVGVGGKALCAHLKANLNHGFCLDMFFNALPIAIVSGKTQQKLTFFGREREVSPLMVF
jgi:2C-methyl-D-erythritol 2,4-cyclodiphosphate synthase